MAGRRKCLLAVSIAVPAFMLCACAAPTPSNQVEPGAGFVFGAFDITGSDIAVTHVSMFRLSPMKVYAGGAGERTTVTYQNGEFYAANLSPGVYAVESFYSGNRPFSLQGALKGNTFRVEPGGVSYAGTYKLAYKRKGLLQSDEASFERIDSRESETRLLRWFAKELAASAWASQVRARLAALEKK